MDSLAKREGVDSLRERKHWLHYSRFVLYLKMQKKIRAKDQANAIILIHSRLAVFFDANERNEPPHVHARKGDADCKYWLRSDTYEIEEDHGGRRRCDDEF